MVLIGQQAATEFERPVDFYAYARGLQKGKVYDFAQKAYEDFLKAYPEHELVESAYANLIDCLRRQEKHDEMIRRISEYGKRWPTNSNMEVFTFWEGESFMQRKMYAQAKECFEKLLKAKNASLKEYSIFLLAGCLFAEDPASKRGYELYSEMASLPLRKDFPFREHAVFALARHFQYEMKFKDALPLFDKIIDYADAKASFREESMFAKGEILFAQGNYAAARAAYDRFLAAFPKGKWSNEVRKRRAVAVFEMNKPEDALKMVLEWRALNPEADDYEMDCLHGRCLYALGEYGTAWPHFDAVVKNASATIEMRRFCLVHAIHCLLTDDKTASWERGAELCKTYFRSFNDAGYENKVMEFEARLHEKLKHYDLALAAYERTLKGMASEDEDRRVQLLLRQSVCYQAQSKWHEAAAILRGLSVRPSCSKERIKYICAAAELELKADKASSDAEKDYLAVLASKDVSNDIVIGSRERLLGIYTVRKANDKAHGQLTELLKSAEGEKREQYLYRDAWLLVELKQPSEALKRLEEALSKSQFADEKREVSMRLLMLKLLQESQLKGDGTVTEKIVGQYRVLAAKPEELTADSLTPPVLYQMSKLLDDVLAKNPNPEDRALLVRTCERAVAKGYESPAAVWAGYRLGRLYMESGDGRYRLAAKVYEDLVSALKSRLEDKEKHAEYLEKLQDADYLLREAMSWLCICYFELGRDADAQSMADMVLSRGRGYAASKRCLLVQARISYERKPQNLSMALEKLANYHYAIPKEAIDPAEEEDAMVLLLKVQRDMGRKEAAAELYKQLKVRYPKRVAQETWMKEFDVGNPDVK